MHHQKEVFTYLEQRERCEYLGINQIIVNIKLDLGALSTQMLIQPNKHFIFSISYDYIKVRCMLCDCVYTVSAFTYLLLCITEY